MLRGYSVPDPNPFKLLFFLFWNFFLDYLNDIMLHTKNCNKAWTKNFSNFVYYMIPS